MRITKKYTGNSSIGKRTFTPLVRSPENVPFIEMSQRELEELRRNWISKLLLAEQWNHRKLNMMKNGKQLFKGEGSPDSSVIHEYNESMDDNEDENEHHPSSSGRMKYNEEAINNALKPYVADPEKVSQILTWLKTSCSAITDSSPPVEELDRLIKMGEISVPILENILKAVALNPQTFHSADSLVKSLTKDPEGKTNSPRSAVVKGEPLEYDHNSDEEKKSQVSEKSKPARNTSDPLAASLPRHEVPPMLPFLAPPGLYNFPGFLPPVDPDKNKNKKKKADRTEPAYPENYPMYYPPNYLYGFPANPALGYPTDFRVPSYQDYLHAVYLQQNPALLSTQHVLPPEAYYDPMYLRQMNQWMVSRSRQNSADGVESPKNPQQQISAPSSSSAPETSIAPTTKVVKAPVVTSSSVASTLRAEGVSSPTLNGMNGTNKKRASKSEDVGDSGPSLTVPQPMKKQKITNDNPSPVDNNAVKLEKTKKPKTPKAVVQHPATSLTPQNPSNSSSSDKLNATDKDDVNIEHASIEFAAEALLGLFNKH
jgi:hypothetical protein